MSKQILDIKLSECGDFVYIKFTDGEYFKISSYDWYGLDFAKKKAETVSDSQFSMLVMLDECSKAKNKLISLLSYSGNSKKGFAQKLKRYGFSEESINYALAFAEEKKLISDENYAEALIHELVNIKKYGPIRVKQEMYRQTTALPPRMVPTLKRTKTDFLNLTKICLIWLSLNQKNLI